MTILIIVQAFLISVFSCSIAWILQGVRSMQSDIDNLHTEIKGHNKLESGFRGKIKTLKSKNSELHRKILVLNDTIKKLEEGKCTVSPGFGMKESAAKIKELQNKIKEIEEKNDINRERSRDRYKGIISDLKEKITKLGGK